MQRALLLIVALTFTPAVASAQQPCTTDARQVVNELYRHMLEREAGSASAGWVQQLESGRMTVRDVVRDIVSSPEYAQRFVYTESGEGTPYERSVARLYRHLLGRQPDAEGQRELALLAQRSGAQAVIDRMLASREYEQQFGDWGVPGSGGIRFCAPDNFVRGQGTTGTDVMLLDRRLQAMDRNRDGVIARNEWRGPRRSFEYYDWNNDGVLSGAELGALSSDMASNAGAVAPTSGQALSIDSRSQWTNTGIDVRAGDLIVFDVDGTIRMSDDPNDTAGPAGAFSGRRAARSPLPGEPAGALIGRIGGGAPFAVGNLRSIRASATGRLFLGINDDYLADNSGQYRVSLTLR